MKTKQSGIRSVVARGVCGVAVAGMVLTALPSPVAAAPVLAVQVVGLRQGSAGADVTAVQQALLNAGITVAGGADGQFGPATRAALLAFQKSSGLTQTGEVDEATAGALGLSAKSGLSSGGSSTASVDGLVPGATGAAVTALQKALIEGGAYITSGANGTFNSSTEKALRDYQRWNGLNQTGVVDDATASHLGLRGAISSSGSATAPATQPATQPVSSSNPYVGLKLGANGSQVKELQQALQRTGLVVRGGADGSFGVATKTSLILFQRVNGFAETGTVSAADAKLLKLGQPAAEQPETTPPAAVSSNPYVGLKLGASGVNVKTLQTSLINAGVTVRGGADGSFGNATKNALTLFQKNAGLDVTGVVDEATANKLGLGTSIPPDPAPTTTPPAASDDPYVGLKYGSQGDKVKELQQALQQTGLVVRGGADGVFGASTVNSLKIFQRVNGLGQTGVVTERGAEILGLGSGDGPIGFANTADGFPKAGESSERVRKLQDQLIAWGITVVGGADGSFGSATSAAIRNFQKAHGLAVTGVVTSATAKKMGLQSSVATPTPSPSSIKLDRFPVQGQCFYGNTWGAARGGGRTHEGVDIIADELNVLYAVVDGTITKMYWDQPGKLSGNGLRVAQDDGTYFTYLHMYGFTPGIRVGTKVKAGDVIGWVGNTGSSATPHVHFEIHPGGGFAVNPYPYVKAVDDCDNTEATYQQSFPGE